MFRTLILLLAQIVGAVSVFSILKLYEMSTEWSLLLSIVIVSFYLFVILAGRMFVWLDNQEEN